MWKTPLRVLFVVMLFSFQKSLAQDWLFIGKNNVDSIMFFVKSNYDYKGKYEDRQNAVTIWVEKIKGYVDEKGIGHEISYRKSLFVFDLQKKQFMVGTTADYNDMGQIVMSYKYDESNGMWQDVIPGSAAEVILKKTVDIVQKSK